MKKKTARRGLQICDDLTGRNYVEACMIDELADIFSGEVRRHNDEVFIEKRRFTVAKKKERIVFDPPKLGDNWPKGGVAKESSA